MTQRSEAEGSKRGTINMWDDKSDHDDVTKIYVNYTMDDKSENGIESVRFDYVKSGKPIDGPFRGQSYNTYTHTVYDDIIISYFLLSFFFLFCQTLFRFFRMWIL